MPEINLAVGVRSRLHVEVVSACISTINALQENMLYSSINAISVATIPVNSGIH